MRGYLLRRLAQMAIVLVFATGFIFAILHLSPGGPFDQVALARGYVTRDYVERLERLIGLNEPLHVRYFKWVFGDSEKGRGGIIRGDFDRSWRVAIGVPVGELIKSRVGNTLILMTGALVLSLSIALVIGIFSAIRQYSAWDYIVTAFSFFGISMPVFWFGMMMIIIFALQFREWGLPFLPVAGLANPGQEGDILDRLNHLVLPVTVLSLFSVAAWSRYVRSSMLEVLSQDYIRTARAKGLIERIVIVKHALRNAFIPLITVVTLSLPNLFSGATITETIFAYPGIGRLFYDSILASDWPVAMGILVVTSVLVVFSNLLADVLYAVADPRIRYA